MKRKFNVVDVVLILLALAACAGVLMLRNRATDAGTGVSRATYPMRYTVEVTRCTLDMEKQMEIGDDVYRSTDNVYLGKLVDLQIIPHTENEYSAAQGAYVRYESEDTHDLYLTIENDGYTTARSFMIGNVEVRIGSEMYVKGKGWARLGYITAIDPMDAPVTENTEVGVGSLEMTYVLRYADVRSLLLDTVHVGDRLYENITGALLGTVEEVWTEPYGEVKLGPNGAQYVEKEDSYFVYVRLTGRAVEKADGYYLDGGTELKVGASIVSTSQYLGRSALYYALEKIEEVG